MDADWVRVPCLPTSAVPRSTRGAVFSHNGRMIDELSVAEVAALMEPGPVLLKLVATGFGVQLSAGPGIARSDSLGR